MSRHRVPWSALFWTALLAGAAGCAIDESEAAPLVTDEASLAASEFAVKSLTSCGPTVDGARELVVTDLSVVNDPLRTNWRKNGYPGDGAWHFGKLMTSMAGPRNAQQFVRQWLAHWETNQTVNELVVPARPVISEIIDAWPKTANGALDLTRPPMRLLAIVNRFDLRNPSAGNAGEGRFVFGVLDADGNATQFTVILEYRLPAGSPHQVRAWAEAWRGLSSYALGTPAYNAALELVTERFARAYADASAINGSAISQVRTNEIHLGFPWELREFRLNRSGKLVESTVARTPDGAFDSTERLVRFINAKTNQILAGTHDIPAKFENLPFRGGSSMNPFPTWTTPGVTNNQARHLFAVNTCNGCHGEETSTSFLHVSPREADQPAFLSGFMTGINVTDPVSREVRHFADIERRAADLQGFLCNGFAPSAAASEFVPLGRVH